MVPVIRRWRPSARGRARSARRWCGRPRGRPSGGAGSESSVCRSGRRGPAPGQCSPSTRRARPARPPGGLRELRRHLPAGPAPGRPEVDEHGHAGARDEGVEATRRPARRRRRRGAASRTGRTSGPRGPRGPRRRGSARGTSGRRRGRIRRRRAMALSYADCAALFTPSFFRMSLERAEAGEAALQEVRAHEGGEPQEVLVHEDRAAGHAQAEGERARRCRRRCGRCLSVVMERFSRWRGQRAIYCRGYGMSTRMPLPGGLPCYTG